MHVSSRHAECRSAGQPGDRSGRPGAGLDRRGFLRGSGLGLAALALAACSEPPEPHPMTASGSTTSGTGGATRASGQLNVWGASSAATSPPGAVTAAQRASRATVPVLCYHQVRPWTGADTSYNREMLIIPPANLGAQLDAIRAAGYTTISPAQYATHLDTGAGLPSKPVILSFDDGKDNQVSAALPALTKRGMTGTFFIMTVILGNAGWMRRDDVRRLADAGMTIGSHTWDHHMVTEYSTSDYATQLQQPRELLRRLSGQEVDDFAYPYGAWKAEVLPHVRKAGYRCAYQLQDKPLDATYPELTLRRILAVSTWTGDQVVAKLAAFS